MGSSVMSSWFLFSHVRIWSWEIDGLSVDVCFASFQRNAFANDTIPSESYISAVQAAHLGTLCGQSLPLAASLKHTLLSLVRLTGDLIV